MRRHVFLGLTMLIGLLLLLWAGLSLLTTEERGVYFIKRLAWSRPYHCYREAKRAHEEGDVARALQYLEQGDARTRGVVSRNALGRLRAGMKAMEGQLLAGLEKNRRAEGAFIAAMEADPHNYSIHIQYGKSLVDSGREQEGEEILLKAFGFHPHHDDVLRILLPLYLEQNRSQEAVALFEQFRDSIQILPVDILWGGQAYRILLNANQSEQPVEISLGQAFRPEEAGEMMLRSSSPDIRVNEIRLNGFRELSASSPSPLAVIIPSGEWVRDAVELNIFNTSEALYPTPSYVWSQLISPSDMSAVDSVEFRVTARKPLGKDVLRMIRSAYRSADDLAGLELFEKWHTARQDAP